MARRYLCANGGGCNVFAMDHEPSSLVYAREQKGHSVILHIVFGGILLWIPTLYYALSPRHYFHA